MSRIEQVTAAAYRVPTDRPEGDGTLAWDALAIPAIWDALVRQVRNAGRPGLAGYAVSALDVALWDLKARLLGTSLAGLFGPARERVPLYGSGGFTTYDDDATAAQLTQNLRHIEWFHDHQRIEAELFDGAADPSGGLAGPVTEGPGHGLTLRPDAAEPYRTA
ncbi:hypothetical protein ABZ917_03765 [Nonomuraea wenchangensis]